MLIPDSLSKQDLPPECLYIVASPIGNLGDLTLRAIHVLNQMDGIACEDKRQSLLLLNHFSIHKPLLALHEHNEREGANELIARLRQGERWAYLSDAGTPGISDPGAKLVMQVRSEGFRVIPIPGVSSVSSALSIAGEVLLNGQGKFQFVGFLPTQKNELEKQLVSIIDSSLPTVFFESPHRIAKTLSRLGKLLTNDRQLLIARELTKKFESITILNPNQFSEWLEDPNNQKGEFVLILAGRNQETASQASADQAKLADLLKGYLGSKDLAFILHQMYAIDKKAAYEMALIVKKGG
jgi:16S rRNA (cytidine1402-2'-O)-methyltransferase